jgi:hypothetical protein
MNFRRPARVLALLAPAPKEAPRSGRWDRKDLPVLIGSVAAACALVGLFLSGLLK